MKSFEEWLNSYATFSKPPENLHTWPEDEDYDEFGNYIIPKSNKLEEKSIEKEKLFDVQSLRSFAGINYNRQITNE